MIRPLLVLVAASSLAFADSATERADAIFKKGKELMATGRYAEACTAFDQSYEIEANPATLLNRADCREKANQLGTAWKLFVEAERVTHAGTTEALKQMNATAQTRATKLAPRVSKVTIKLAAAQPAFGVMVTINGEVATLDKPISLDGGNYTIAATALGRAPWSRKLALANEGANEIVEVPVLDAVEGQPPSQPPKQDPARSPEATVTTAETPKSRSKAPALIVGGVGIALGGAAIGMVLSGNKLYDRSKLEENDAEQEALWQSANKRRYLAQGFAVGSLVCVGVATVLLVRGRGESTKLSVAPTASTSSVGVAIGRAW